MNRSLLLGLMQLIVDMYVQCTRDTFMLAIGTSF